MANNSDIAHFSLRNTSSTAAGDVLVPTDKRRRWYSGCIKDRKDLTHKHAQYIYKTASQWFEREKDMIEANIRAYLE